MKGSKNYSVIKYGFMSDNLNDKDITKEKIKTVKKPIGGAAVKKIYGSKTVRFCLYTSKKTVTRNSTRQIAKVRNSRKGSKINKVLFHHKKQKKKDM
jgi:hypothetical protein